MRRLDLGLLVATVATVATGAVNANADELRGRFVRVGVARVSPDPNHVVASLNGVPVPGASFNAETEYGIAAEVGIYLFNSPVSLSLSVTSPVTTANIGTGAFAATPELGADSFMLGALTANYHFNREGRISPYFGGGLGYFYPTGSLDGVVTDLHIGGAYGSVLQAGADFNATDSWGAFVDVKQFRIDIDATGIAFGESLVANAAIDPLVVSLGMSHRF